MASGCPVIGKLTKNLYNTGKSPIKLMHQRKNPSAQTAEILKNDLTIDKFPDILRVSNASTTSHFVVAKGIKTDTYSINDPEWNASDLLSFNNTYSQVDRYVPSHTNLSYIVIVVNPEVEVLVINKDGSKIGKYINNGATQIFNQIPDATYSFQPPISNQGQTLGTGVNEFLLPIPDDEVYSIILSSQSNSPYTINIATFKEDGNNSIYKSTGLIGPNKDESFALNYSQTEDSNAVRIVTFQTIINDIKNVLSQGLIEDKFAEKLSKIIEKGEEKNLQEALLVKLHKFEKEINKERGQKIKEDAFQILLYDITYLKSHL